MSEYEDNERDRHEPVAFGQQLMLAREKAGMTIDEAARALNLKIEIVEAIEDSALDRLPPVAFVQGYVRTYARLLELPEDRILQEFDAEVPHQMESELHPRPPSPDGANSQSPVIKLVSLLVVVLAAVVLGYAVFSYYVERTERIEQAAHTADDVAMPPPADAPLIEQPVATTWEALEAEDTAAVPEDTAAAPEPADPVAVDPGEEPAITTPLEAEVAPEQEVAETVVEETVAAASSEVTIEEIMPVTPPQPITGGDVLAVRSEQECWAEIVDANDIRMFYGMIRPGRDLKLTGQAPFEVFLGNAPAVTLSLNAIDVDMTKYIRSNNIAQFKLSVEDGRVRFH